MNTKHCSKCGQDKLAGEFYRSSSRSDGLQRHCKSCQNAARDARLQTERGRAVARAGALRWHRENPDRSKQIRLEWARRNPEKAQRWQRGNPEAFQALTKARQGALIAGLADQYVRQLVGRKLGIPATQIPAALIDAKRAQLRVIRLIKEQAA